ncbi:hypothetical protein E4U42_007168 [Claviceps africana]|uniref:AAA+ ATPase domain-containing protein n=1 Tax=Claviceps africana TaxID=83212 RepID=A0A8K0J2A4_9HYPO|nr:hypothetical protein E4U42_007168 [Claviceps africana]
MAPLKPRPRITLQSRLECDIDKVLKQLESSNGGQRFTSTPDAYDAIQRSNSSLKRLKKRPLEDAIDRVLLFHKQEAGDSSDSEAALEKSEEPTTVPGESGFLLNRQMTKLWHRDTSATTTATTTNSAAQSPAKKRRLQEEGEDAMATTKKVRPDGNASTEVTLSTQQKQLPKKIQKISRFTVEHVDRENPLGGLGNLPVNLVKLAWGSLMLPGYDEKFKVERRTGVIISGPQGMGKKTLVKNVAYRLAVPLVSLDMCFFDSERMEKNMIEAFDAALAQPRSIIFIGEVHRHMARPGSSQYNDSHAKATNLFRLQMQRLAQHRGADSLHIAIATTSNIDDVDPDLLRHGMFEETLKPEIPDYDARKEILKIAIGEMIPGDDVDLDEIARITHGFVPAELTFITKLAKQSAIKTFSDEDDVELRGTEIESAFLAGDKNEVLQTSRLNMRPKAPLSMDHFKTALEGFVPALRKEGFTVIPNVTWDQVGALEVARKQLQKYIIGPIKWPAQYEEWGLPRSAGVLLWGPPGCGKTLIAQAVANDAKASFILINGPELLNKYVGESERAVRELFQRARSSQPCILFFDEVDSIVPPRANTSTETGARLVNALLTELDGAKDRNGVYVIGTTNRPELIDEAILRPGRLGTQIFVDLPTPSERVDILRAIHRTRQNNTTPAELEALAKVALDTRCSNFSGADLSELRAKAAHSAMERSTQDEDSPKGIVSADWEFALNNTRASVKDPDAYRKRNMV